MKKPTCYRGRILLSKTLFCLLQIGFAQQPVILDADTGNEVDDLYALVRVLLEPSITVTALNATHWQTSHWSVARSMENSHRLNQQLLGELDMNVKTLRGAPARMYDWGDRAQHSAAASEIIAQAQQEQEVVVIALGALTNVASAIYIRPDIAPRLKVYWLGTTFDFDRQVLKRNDFNPLMDPFALDYVLDSKVDLYIMPVNVATAMEIGYRELKAAIGTHEMGKLLLKRWNEHLDGARQRRTLWDLALVTAFIAPEMAETQVITTSRDSGHRPITFYKAIDAQAIYNDFYKVLLAFEQK
ncbi:MAG: nucleoside hydrolase [Bacteroidota bacterium]